ncbi:MAG: hypothetical protein AB7S65_13240 [Sulfuricurvum sp.]
MNIDIVNDHPNHTKISIKGIVKSFSDSQQIKDTVENVARNSNHITIEFVESFALTSSVIGYLMKKVQADNLNLSIITHNDQLFELLNMLSLTSLFNVQKAPK